MNFIDFFAPKGKFAPSGAFSLEHIIIAAISLLSVLIALLLTRRLEKEKILKIIRILAISISVLEVVKISFTLATGSIKDINSYVPLYFCSIAIYAGLLAGFAKGWWRRTGEIFLSTGGIVGGLCFILFPLTSINIYPTFHFITVYSFALHAAMIYMGLLLLTSGYTRLESSDIDRFFLLVTLISVAAFVINITLHTNLMFISQNYPGTIIELAYNLFPGLLFPLFMFLLQATVPFYSVYFVYRAVRRTDRM
jgi:hypothetical integral membrane protein (TIGR02206 family)